MPSQIWYLPFKCAQLFPTLLNFGLLSGICSHSFLFSSDCCMYSWDSGSHLNGRSQVCEGTLSSQQGSQLMQGTSQGAPHSRLSVQKQLAVCRPQLCPLLLTSTGQHSREVERSGKAQL